MLFVSLPRAAPHRYLNIGTRFYYPDLLNAGSNTTPFERGWDNFKQVLRARLKNDQRGFTKKLTKIDTKKSGLVSRRLYYQALEQWLGHYVPKECVFLVSLVPLLVVLFLLFFLPRRARCRAPPLVLFACLRRAVILFLTAFLAQAHFWTAPRTKPCRRLALSTLFSFAAPRRASFRYVGLTAGVCQCFLSLLRGARYFDRMVSESVVHETVQVGVLSCPILLSSWPVLSCSAVHSHQ